MFSVNNRKREKSQGELSRSVVEVSDTKGSELYHTHFLPLRLGEMLKRCLASFLNY